jgi:CRP/FNR family transcriptional regulator
MLYLKVLRKYTTQEWQEVFLKSSTRYSYNAGEYVFSQNDTVSGIYFIEEGFVKVLTQGLNNEDKIIRLASEGMILGVRGLNSKTYSVSAVTLSDSELTFVPINVFNDILLANPRLGLHLINFLSGELRETELRMNNLLILSPRVRFANVLCKQIDVFGYRGNTKLLAFTLTRKDMANLAGTTYETIVRTIAEFCKRKLIKTSGKELMVVNENYLREIASGGIDI